MTLNNSITKPKCDNIFWNISYLVIIIITIEVEDLFEGGIHVIFTTKYIKIKKYVAIKFGLGFSEKEHSIKMTAQEQKLSDIRIISKKRKLLSSSSRFLPLSRD